MRETLHLNLPSLTTFYRWSPVKNLNPGINKEVGEGNIRYDMVKVLEVKDKECMILMDEILARIELEYNPKTDRADREQTKLQ